VAAFVPALEQEGDQRARGEVEAFLLRRAGRDRGDEEAFLGVEVARDQRRIDAGALADLPRRRPVVADRLEDLLGGFEQGTA
jgi:hypothetical protein